MASAWQSYKDWKHDRESLRLRSQKVDEEERRIREYVQKRQAEKQ